MHQTAVALVALVLTVSTVAAVSARDPIVVTIDRAKVMRLPAPADTVIVGNPGIADATIHDKMTLILTGKMTGTTNLVILDAKGEAIADEIISVAKISDGLVSVQRAGNRYSYSCTPDCNAMFEVGDQKDHFDTTAQQIGKRNGLGQPSGAQ
jgi:hypothetical protein